MLFYIFLILLDLAQYYNLAVIKDSKHLPFGGKSLENVNSNNIRTDGGINHSTLNALHLQSHNQSMFQTDVDITRTNHRNFLNQSKYLLYLFIHNKNKNEKYNQFAIIFLKNPKVPIERYRQPHVHRHHHC